MPLSDGSPGRPGGGQIARSAFATIDQKLKHIVSSLAAWKTCHAEITVAITGLNEVWTARKSILAFDAGVIEIPPSATCSKAAMLASLLPEAPKELLGPGRRSPLS